MSSSLYSQIYSLSLRQYKQDTDFIAQNLLLCSRQYGYMLPSRKSTASSSQTIYTIACEDYLPMARHIAAHESAYTYLPSDFFHRLDQAINGRLQAHRYHCAQAAVQDVAKKDHKTKNKKHKYFLNILEDVRSVLHTQRGLESKRGDLTTSSDNMLMSIQIEYQHDTQEKLSMLMSLLEDLNEIRATIKQLWSRSHYLGGDLDLVTISLVTNSALEMAQTIEAEYSDALGGADRVKTLHSTLWLAHCHTQGQDPNESLDSGKYPPQIYEASFQWFWHLKAMLQLYADGRSSDILRVYKKDFYGQREAFDPYKNLPARQKYHVDKMFLTEILPHFDILAIIGGQQMDEITASLCSVLGTRTVSLTSCLAVQVLLDISHELEDHPEKAYLELRRSANQYAENVSEVLMDRGIHMKIEKSKSNEKTLQAFASEVQAFTNLDMIQEYIQARSLKLPQDSVFEPHYLAKNHPLLCGLELFKLRARYRHLGIQYVNNAGAIPSCIYLYHAFRKSGVLGTPWPDLELTQLVQAKEQIFAGPIPQTPKDFLVSYRSMTYDAPMHTTPIYALSPYAMKAKSRPLASLAGVSNLFVPRYAMGFRSCGIQAIEAQLRKMDRYDDAVKLTSLPTSGLLARLNLICASLRMEVHEFCLDYFQLHLLCMMTLRVIQTTFQELDLSKDENVTITDQTLRILQCLEACSSHTPFASGNLDTQYSSRLVEAAASGLSNFISLKSNNIRLGELTCHLLSQTTGVDLSSVMD